MSPKHLTDLDFRTFGILALIDFWESKILTCSDVRICIYK